MKKYSFYRHYLSHLALALLATHSVLAQSPNPAPVGRAIVPTTPQVTYQVAQAAPAAASTNFNNALGLIDQLRKGGHVIYIHHGESTLDREDKMDGPMWWKNCATTKALSPLGLLQATNIGNAIRNIRIPILALRSSEYCRAMDTANALRLSSAQLIADLNASPAQYAVGRKDADISRAIQAQFRSLGGANLVLIGHALPAAAAFDTSLYGLREGETAIFKVDGEKTEFIVKINPEQWRTISQTEDARATNQPNTAPPAGQPNSIPAPTGPNTGVPPGAQPPPNYSNLIAAGKELKGLALITALKAGGYVLYMRHASATLGADGSVLLTPEWWNDCTIQRNLSDAGKEQTNKVGSAIRELNIPIGEVRVGQFCRTRETGHLLGLGAIIITEDLNHAIGQRAGFDINAARIKHLLETPMAGKNNFLVSHTHGSPRTEESVMGQIQEGEIAVFLPDGKGKVELVARIPVADWDNLRKLATPPKS